MSGQPSSMMSFYMKRNVRHFMNPRTTQCLFVNLCGYLYTVLNSVTCGHLVDIQQMIHMYQKTIRKKSILKNFSKLLFICSFNFLHFFFYRSYFPSIFSSFSCDSCGLYSLHAITPLLTLYLSIFCHTVNLLELHIFCSHLPHRAISSYSWQSCIAECF